MKKLLLPLVLASGMAVAAPQMADAEPVMQLAEAKMETQMEAPDVNVEMPDVQAPEMPDTNVTESVTEVTKIDADTDDADVAGISASYLLIFALLAVALVGVIVAATSRRSTV